jgi:hypothetical protein
MEAQRLRFDQISLTQRQGTSYQLDVIGGRRGGALGSSLFSGPMHGRGQVSRRGRQPDNSKNAVRGKAGIRGDTPLVKIVTAGSARDYPIKPAPPPVKVKPAGLRQPTDRQRGRQTRGGAILGAVRGEPSSASSTSSIPLAWPPPPPPPAHRSTQPALQPAHRQYSAPVDGAWGLGCSDRHHVCFDRPITSAQAPRATQLPASAVSSQSLGAASTHSRPSMPRKQFLITSRPFSGMRRVPLSSHSAPLPEQVAAPTSPQDVTPVTPRSQVDPRPLQDLFVSDREWPFAAHDTLESPLPDSKHVSHSPKKAQDALLGSPVSLPHFPVPSCDVCW